MSRSREPNAPAPISRRTFAKTGVAAAGLGAASSIISKQGVAQAATALKVALILPRSGHLARSGRDCQRGADVALAMLEELGYPSITLIAADTETKVARARAAAENAVAGKANALIGAFDSAQTFAVAQVAEQNNIPLVINIAAAPQITEQGYKFVFRNFPTAVRFIMDAFGLQRELYSVSNVRPKTAVLMHVNNTMGKSIVNAIKALHGKFKMPYRIVETVAVDPRARDLSSEVAKAKASNADILWTTNLLHDAILTTKEMVKQRWTPMGVLSSGPGYFDEAYYKTLGKHSDFILSFTPWVDPSKPLTARFLRKFHEMYPGATLNPQVVFTFEAVVTLADAYKRAGSRNPKELAAALRTTNIKGNISLGAGIAFDKKGQNAGIRLAAIQNQDQKPHVVLPGAAAEAKVIFPHPGSGKKR